MNLDLHISPLGDNHNPGTREQPFSSLARAVAFVREARAQSSVPLRATLHLAAGDYPTHSSIRLHAADSSAAAALTIRAEPGARLIGGQPVGPWSSVTDPAVLARLDPKARGHVLQCNLRESGVTHLSNLVSRGFQRQTPPAHSQLIFDNRPMTLAQWPNAGEPHQLISSIPASASKPDGHGGTVSALEAGFHFKNERTRRWADLGNAWVHGFWSWDWANTYEKIESLDPDSGLIKLAPPYGWGGYRAGQRIYFLNLLEELDQPGEYFIDHDRFIAYFWPPSPIDQGQTLVTTLSDPVIDLRDASHVTIEGLQILGANGYGIHIHGGENNLISGCTISCTGSYGVWIEKGRNHRVDQCHIHHNGDGGVYLDGGDRHSLVPSNHAVTRSHLHHQAIWSRCYHHAVQINGVGQTVSHNHIHDHPHCAIQFTGNNHLIDSNHIHHVCQETGDVGAIYVGRDFTEAGTLIQHNFIHHIDGPGKLGAIGVYLDDCSSGTTIRANVFAHAQTGVMIGGGRRNNVESNLFIDCKLGVQVDGRGMDLSPTWKWMYLLMIDRLHAMRPELEPYAGRYPWLSRIKPYHDAGVGVPPEENRVDGNVALRCGAWSQIYWFAKPEDVAMSANQVDAGSVIVSPVDAADARALLAQLVGLSAIGT